MSASTGLTHSAGGTLVWNIYPIKNARIETASVRQTPHTGQGDYNIRLGKLVQTVSICADGTFQVCSEDVVEPEVVPDPFGTHPLGTSTVGRPNGDLDGDGKVETVVTQVSRTFSVIVSDR